MYSVKNSFKVFVSPFIGPTNVANVSDLPEGEVGFFESDTGDLIAGGIGTGYLAKLKNGIVYKSEVFTFAGFAAAVKSYSAPTPKQATVTIPSAVASTTYLLDIEIKFDNMRNGFNLVGEYTTAASGDTTTTIAAGLVAAINAQLTKEGKTDLLTVTSNLAVITIVSKTRTAVVGKKFGRPVSFYARLSAPEALATAEVITVAPSDGIGYGPYTMEKEYLAWGEHDHHRMLGWRNNFEFGGDAEASGTYDVGVINLTREKQTANANVNAPMDILVAFNVSSAGVTPQPIIDAAEDGDTTVTGVAYPGSSVILSVDGSPESPVTANGTTGIWSVTVTVATGEVLTATAQDSGSAVSPISDAVTVTAT